MSACFLFSLKDSVLICGASLTSRWDQVNIKHDLYLCWIYMKIEYQVKMFPLYKHAWLICPYHWDSGLLCLFRLTIDGCNQISHFTPAVDVANAFCMIARPCISRYLAPIQIRICVGNISVLPMLVHFQHYYSNSNNHFDLQECVFIVWISCGIVHTAGLSLV